MKLRILILLCSMSFALMASAQASGGQIRRTTTKPRTEVKKQPKTYNATPQVEQSMQPYASPTFQPQTVDLGLPSGTLWADRNLGANSSEGYGDYFAWGEIKSKKICSGSNYKYIRWNEHKLTKYCVNSKDGKADWKTELDLDDDAAYTNLGQNWRIPSDEQFKELIDSRYTQVEWVDYQTIKGAKIISRSNGNSIFLPASGFLSGDWLSSVNENGNYWSRNLYVQRDSHVAFSLHISQFNIKQIKRDYVDNKDPTPFGTRYYGQSIRPVYMPE